MCSSCGGGIGRGSLTALIVTVVGLARIYIENGHEDMIRLGCADQNADASEQKRIALDEYTERVRHLYPAEVFGDPSEQKGNGGILREVAEMARVQRAKHARGESDVPFEAKNAVEDW